MINLPDNSLLTIRKLNQVFNNTTASYKFYWFISILEIYGSGKESKITFKEIISRMIANAWYPVHYFKLSFGMFDMLSKYILEIQNILQLSMELEKEKIYQAILQTENPEILKMIYNLSLNVPYRFLSPWTSFENNTTQVLRSQFYYNNCPYSIHIDKSNYIIINPDWEAYLNENQKILLDFCYWNLTSYLQSKNPNVPDVAGKLIKPIQRSSLSAQRNYWKTVLKYTDSIKCLYTGNPIDIHQFELDHFIPWSFVSHDLQWNLIPSEKGINTSKSNKIPILEKYIAQLSEQQQVGISIIYKHNPNNKLLEDFSIIGQNTIYELINLNQEDFRNLYRNTLSPLIQIAENMGFQTWEN